MKEIINIVDDFSDIFIGLFALFCVCIVFIILSPLILWEKVKSYSESRELRNKGCFRTIENKK